MRRTAIATLLSLALAPGAATQDGPPAGEPAPGATSAAGAAASQRFEGGLFVVDIPADWRRLGPAEALQLGDQLPLDMRQVTPGQVFALGAVDRWLEDGFDGRALLVVAQQFERPVDAENLREIEEFWRSWRGPDGTRREVLSTGLVEVGADGHPAMEFEMRVVPGDPAARPLRTLDLYASTMGQQLILSLRAWDNLWEESEPDFRRMAESIVFARPPQEPEALGDRLLYAVFVGGLVGIVLLLARHRIRNRRA